MTGLILICTVIIVIETSIILFLCYKIGNERCKKLQTDMDRIIQNLGHVTSLLNSLKKTSEVRATTIKSQLSQTSQNIKSALSQTDKSLSTLISHVEGNVITELQSSSGAIQNSILQAHTSWNKSIKTKFDEMKCDLLEVKRVMRENKDEILRTQAQSFSCTDSKINTIQKEEHSYLQDEFLSGKKRLSDVQTIFLKKFQTEEESLSSLNGSIQDMSSLLDQHLTSLKPLEELLARLENLYNRLISLDDEIIKQECSLSGMVEKHVTLVEYTKELSETSKNIYDLMKLVLIKSITQQIQSPKK